MLNIKVTFYFSLFETKIKDNNNNCSFYFIFLVCRLLLQYNYFIIYTQFLHITFITDIPLSARETLRPKFEI